MIRLLWALALLFSLNEVPPITPENVAQITILNRLELGDTSAQAIAFNPLDSHELAAAQADGTLSIWDVTTGKTRITWQAAASRLDSIVLTALVYTADGKKLITADTHGNIKIWDSANGVLLKILDVLNETPNVLDITPNNVLAAGYEYGNVRLWNVDTGDNMLNLYGYGGHMDAIAISPDGKRVALGYSVDHVVIYRLDNIQRQHIYIEQILDVYELNDLAFVPNPQPYEYLSSDYGLATTSNFFSTQFWDAQFAITVHTWGTESTMVYPESMDFNHNGTLVAVGGKATAAGGWCESNPCPIEIIQGQHDPDNVEAGLPILVSLEEPQTGPLDVTFSNDDRYLAASFQNGIVLIWGITE